MQQIPTRERERERERERDGPEASHAAGQGHAPKEGSQAQLDPE